MATEHAIAVMTFLKATTECPGVDCDNGPWYGFIYSSLLKIALLFAQGKNLLFASIVVFNLEQMVICSGDGSIQDNSIIMSVAYWLY